MFVSRTILRDWQHNGRSIAQYLLTVNRHCEVLFLRRGLACTTDFSPCRFALHALAGCILTVRFMFAYD